jgi:hypothetical protein
MPTNNWGISYTMPNRNEGCVRAEDYGIGILMGACQQKPCETILCGELKVWEACVLLPINIKTPIVSHLAGFPYLCTATTVAALNFEPP